MSVSPLPADFDPGASSSATGTDALFGLPTGPEESRVIVVPVPFEATVSYGDGTANGPSAVLAASQQVDLFDRRTGRPYRDGIAMLPLESARCVREWSDAARETVAAITAARAADGVESAGERVAEQVAEVDRLCAAMNDWVREQVAAKLDAGKLVFTLGGDHSVAFGSIAAHAAHDPGLGILHIDAHHDLRPAYDSFTWSHASVLFNVLAHVPGVAHIAQIGIRDFSEEEARIAHDAGGRISVNYDVDVKERQLDGESFARIADDVVDSLPRRVYLTFDIDGLDPLLCPGTGTPVPGGLAWHEVVALLQAIVRSGRTIVGGDLVEVAPQPGDREWNANVGARLLYKMIGYAHRSR